MKDEYAVVLDFIPSEQRYGRPPIAQVVGTRYFTLLEVVVRPGVTLKPGDKVYIGPEKREEVQRIVRRLKYDDLTGFAKSELENAVRKIVEEDEKRFVEFFNNAKPITVRLHSLELLPSIGKKHMWDIIEERKKKPFESFEEIRKRVKMMPDPKEIIVRRILEEIEGKDVKYRLFVPR